jgi:hypothetical protein
MGTMRGFKKAILIKTKAFSESREPGLATARLQDAALRNKGFVLLRILS